jgi:hypothetical protein
MHRLILARLGNVDGNPRRMPYAFDNWRKLAGRTLNIGATRYNCSRIFENLAMIHFSAGTLHGPHVELVNLSASLPPNFIAVTWLLGSSPPDFSVVSQILWFH